MSRKEIIALYHQLAKEHGELAPPIMQAMMLERIVQAIYWRADGD